MEKYIGIKVVEAVPLTAGKAIEAGYLRFNNNEVRPANDAEGYEVVYSDGYKSWCPKDVFEKYNFCIRNQVLAQSCYQMMSADYKERFIAEYNQLKNRYDNLCKMLDSWDNGILSFNPTCPRELYDLQIEGMRKYLNALIVRAKIENIEL